MHSWIEQVRIERRTIASRLIKVAKEYVRVRFQSSSSSLSLSMFLLSPLIFNNYI